MNATIRAFVYVCQSVFLSFVALESRRAALLGAHYVRTFRRNIFEWARAELNLPESLSRPRDDDANI